MMKTETNQVFQLVKDLLYYINHNKLFGLIPLDIVAHILVSYFYTLFGLFFKFKLHIIFISLFCLEIAKEVYDSTTLQSPWAEHIKDVIVTFLYPAYVLILRYVKRKASQSPESSQ